MRRLGCHYKEAEPGAPISNSAIRTILFTDIEGSMVLTRQLGDEQAMKVLRLHDDIINKPFNVQMRGSSNIRATA